MGYDFRTRIRSSTLRIDKPSGALRLAFLIALLVFGLFQGEGEISSAFTRVSRFRETKLVELGNGVGDSQQVQVVENATAPIMVSLWLLPPESRRPKLQNEIDRLAEGRGPSFAPHVTVVGSIPCQSEQHALEMGKKLQEGLKGFGKIPCQFNNVPYSSKGAWSQGLFLVMDVSAPYMNLCQKSRGLLGMDTENWRFPAPAGLPHLSLFYGVKNVPEKKEVMPVPAFFSYELALWLTNPSTLEGVPEWKEMTTISIK
jgi:hypothetical protein